MAAVRVESEAENDIRFHLLAKQAGLADADHAIGKMLRLWRACTNRQSYVLSEAVVACVVDPDALVAAELGERVDGGIRIRGTKGRIEWLGERRKASRKGGLANRAKWVPPGSAKKSQEPAKTEPLGSRAESPNSNSPANSPAPAKQENEQSPLVLASPLPQTRRRAESKRPAKLEHELPSEWRPTTEHAERASALGVTLETEERKFRAHAATHGRKAKVWNAAFTGWLENAPSFSGHGGGARASPGLSARQIWDMAVAEEAKEKQLLGGGE